MDFEMYQIQLENSSPRYSYKTNSRIGYFRHSKSHQKSVATLCWRLYVLV